MTRLLLDTNHASRLFQKVPGISARTASATDVEFLLCRPSIAELWFMVYNSGRIEHNRREMTAFLRRFRKLEFTAMVAKEFGRMKAELRRAGRPVPDVDAQIGATARIHDLTLLTADKHFAHITGLRTENWLGP